MSGTPIRTELRMSAEVRAAALAAREAARRRRTVAVERRVATELERRGVATGDRIGLLRARAEALAAEIDERDEGLAAHAREAAALAATTPRDAMAISRAEASLDAVEREADAAAGHAAVREVLLRRVIGELPPSLRADVAAMRPAPSGALRVEAFRATGHALGIEVDGDADAGVAPLTLDLARSGLDGPSWTHAERCAQERRAAGQLMERLARAGLVAGPLERDDDAVRTARRRRARPTAGAAGRTP